MNKPSWILAALTALLLLAQPAQAEWTRLTDAELIRLLSNMNLRITMPTTGRQRLHHMQPVTAPGEKARLYSGKVIDRGWWSVENREFYFEYWWVKGLLQICFAVEREGESLRFHHVRAAAGPARGRRQPLGALGRSLARPAARLDPLADRYDVVAI